MKSSPDSVSVLVFGIDLLHTRRLRENCIPPIKNEINILIVLFGQSIFLKKRCGGGGEIMYVCPLLIVRDLTLVNRVINYGPFGEAPRGGHLFFRELISRFLHASAFSRSYFPNCSADPNYTLCSIPFLY